MIRHVEEVLQLMAVMTEDTGVTFLNNHTKYWSISSIAQCKNPQRSPLRLRFLHCTLKEISCVFGMVIFKTVTLALKKHIRRREVERICVNFWTDWKREEKLEV